MFMNNLKEASLKTQMATRVCDPNTFVSCALIGEWIVSDCLTKKCVIYTSRLAWSQYDLSRVTWYDSKIGMASTPALLYEVSLFWKSDQDWPTQEAKRVMMHTTTIANFTLGRQKMQNAYLFEMLNI